MIPKIIHQIWVGDNPLPGPDYEFAETIRTKNPDWDFVLWAEHPSRISGGPWASVEQAPDVTMQHLVDVFHKRARPEYIPAAVSDILRVQILIEHGGVYLDTDVFAVRPLESVIGDSLRLAISQEFSSRMIGNFMLAGTPGHPALWRCLDEYDKRVSFHFGGSGDFKPVGITGPIPTSAKFREHPDCILFPWPIFSPWSQDHALPPNWREIPWSSSTVCVHAFGSRWINVDKTPMQTLREGMQPVWRPRVDHT